MSLPFSVNFRLVVHKQGLKDLPRLLSKELRGSLTSVGKRLEDSAGLRMRKDSGESIKSLTREVRGAGLDLHLSVYSTLLKAFIDAYGMRPGTRVPYGFGSRLHNWAQRKVRVGDSQKPRMVVPTYQGAGPNRVFQAKTKRVRGITSVKASRVTVSAGAGSSARVRSKNRAASRLAYLTARAIYQRGIQATRWNKMALEANKARIIRELKNAISRTVNRLARG